MSTAILDGIRVIELGPYIALPLTGRLLAALGAEVIKVESNRVLDPTIFIPGWAKGAGQPEYQELKRRITLDVRRPAGRAVFERLVGIADVLLTNFRRSVLARWGIDLPRLRALRPDLVIVHQTAFGAGGPYESYKLYGILAQHASGVSFMTGTPGPAPCCVNAAYSDYHTPVFQALGVLVALLRRRRSGQGALVEGSIFKSGACTVGPALLDYQLRGELPARLGNRDLQAAPHGIYPCRGEDEWVALAVFGDEDWAALGRALGSPAWAGEERFATPEARRAHAEALDRLLAEWSRERDKNEAAAALQAEGVAAAPVAKGRDLVESEHLRARGFWRETAYFVPDPRRPGSEWKRGPDVIAGRVPIGFSATPSRAGDYRRIGEDNDYVYRELLGMEAAEVEELARQGVLT